ncbi:MAG: DHHA1 domain-containing protein [candidate division Zixibacteria bacterium]|nr:DHHA1 domain-containing protein [candidate division Zixibacteria bacterium]
MTERLYYTNPSLLSFEATITSKGMHKDLYYTVLDRSAFYPTSGGQLHDKGVLGGEQVVEVIESESSQVWHLSTNPAGEVGDLVTGVVDETRRKRNRQLHSAQHLLSAAFTHLLKMETVSVHLGEEYGAVELQTSGISDEQIETIERSVNDLISQNLEISILFATGDELAAIPLRKPSSREGIIRIIKIGDYDWSACGGTHCSQTSEIGLVKIIGPEKMRGHILVKFLAGEQALADYAFRFKVTQELSQLLTCHPSDLLSKVQKLLSDNKTARTEIKGLQEALLPTLVAQLAEKKVRVSKTPFLFHHDDNLDPALLSPLASQLAMCINGVVIITSQERLVLSVSQTTGHKANELVKSLCQSLGLRGGGNESVAQIGGVERKMTEQIPGLITDLLSKR